MKVYINFFEITLSPQRCVLSNFLFILRDHYWYLLVVMIVFIPLIVIDLF